MIDDTGRQIIAQRNGASSNVQLGAVKRAKALTPEDQQLLARMQTNRQARAVLGIVAQYLQRGYQIAETVSSFISPIDGTKQLATSMRSLLDATNKRAQQVYASLPDDDAPLSAQNRRKVDDVMIRTREVLTIVRTDAEDMNTGLTGALVDLLISKLPSWLQPKSPQGKKTLVYVAVGAAVLIGAVVVYKLVSNIVFSGASLGAAEEDALAIADAKRRKRHNRSAFSIS